MERAWSAALWPQFGAAIDVLDSAITACPDALWTERVWPAPPANAEAVYPAAYWIVTYHAIIWLDLYLTVSTETGSFESFAPPAPFSSYELEDGGVPPAEPYTAEQLRGYLAHVRHKASAMLTALTADQALRPFVFPWEPDHSVSVLELYLYTMRHTQEHGSQLLLFLGQRGLPEVPDWVMWAGVGADEA
jgi:hypothetical protein